MVQSRTGSGKTGAFLLPALEQIDPARPRARCWCWRRRANWRNRWPTKRASWARPSVCAARPSTAA
ncbi:MAG: hypothetical protein R3A10_07780 [Caldilineaceae bacterium]